MNLKNVLDYLQLFLVQGSFVHLWYFPAVIVSVLALHWLFNRVSFGTITVLVSVLYIFGILGDGYYGILKFLPQWFISIMHLYQGFFRTTRNGIFFGIPFVFIGAMISKYENKIFKLNHRIWLTVSIFSVCLEAYVLNKLGIAQDYNMTISMVPATIFLFCTLIKIPTKHKVNFHIYRKYSTLIYECHLLFYGVVLATLFILDIDMFQHSAIQFIIVVLLSQLFACIVLWLSQKPKYSWLKAIY